MLKPYHSTDSSVLCRSVDNVAPAHSHPSKDETTFGEHVERSVKLRNSDVLSNLSIKLSHLLEKEKNVIKLLVEEFFDLFPDVLGKTTAACHELDVGAAHPIKQHPYRMNPTKLAAMRQEVEYILQHGIKSQELPMCPGPQISKPDCSVRFCTNLRRINA